MSVEIDAVALLEEQHRDMEKLFAELEKVDGVRKRKQFAEIADKLAIHATIEELHFYPVVKAERTEASLLESLEEHLGIKRVLMDLLAVHVDDKTFDARVGVLKQQVEHHVKEEERELFPKVRQLVDEATLMAVAQEMTATQQQLIAETTLGGAEPSATKQAVA